MPSGGDSPQSDQIGEGSSRRRPIASADAQQASVRDLEVLNACLLTGATGAFVQDSELEQTYGGVKDISRKRHRSKRPKAPKGSMC